MMLAVDDYVNNFGYEEAAADSYDTCIISEQILPYANGNAVMDVSRN